MNSSSQRDGPTILVPDLPTRAKRRADQVSAPVARRGVGLAPSFPALRPPPRRKRLAGRGFSPSSSKIELHCAAPEVRMRVLVTGAASGVGRATCLRLARDARARGQAAKIAAVDVAPLRELDGLREELRKLDAEALPLRGDMGGDEGPARVVGEAVDRFGGLDGLVSNAGINRPGTLLQYAVDDWDRVFAVNTRATWLLAKAAHPALTRATSPATPSSSTAVSAEASSAACRASPRSRADETISLRRADTMGKKLLFVGAGAIGSYLGAFLSRAGHDVTLVDPWADQVETIRERGISVTGPHEPFEARPAAIHVHQAAPCRATTLAAMLSVIDGAQVTDTLWGERWAKLCANAMGNPVQAMSGLGSLEIASSEVGRTITIHLAAESARVGLALGYRVPKFNGPR